MDNQLIKALQDAKYGDNAIAEFNAQLNLAKSINELVAGDIVLLGPKAFKVQRTTDTQLVVNNEKFSRRDGSQIGADAYYRKWVRPVTVPSLFVHANERIENIRQRYLARIRLMIEQHPDKIDFETATKLYDLIKDL